MPLPAQRDAAESARRLAEWLGPKLGADGPVQLGEFRGPGATGFSNETIIVDGGFYRGTDVVKAIALGANLVGMGRLPCYGLAAANEAGLQRVIELLEDEITICLGLLGVHSLAMLDRSYLHLSAPVVSHSSVRSAFGPLLEAGY